jgi:hypothetical protein
MAASYDILHATGGFDGTAFSGVSLSNPSLSATLSYTATDVMLNLNPVSSVPGPIAGAGLPGLVVACGVILVWWRRRRRRQTAYVGRILKGAKPADSRW